MDVQRYLTGFRPVCVFAILLLFATSVHADGIEEGLGWLTGTRDANGIHDTEGSRALALQANMEAARVLMLSDPQADTLPPALSTAFAQASSGLTEFLSYHIQAQALEGAYGTDALETLQARQNHDGGFGNFSGYSSSVLATGFALLAFHDAGIRDERAGRAITFLHNRQRADGGWSEGVDNASSIHVTALALQALGRHSGQFAVSEAVEAGRDHLLSRREDQAGAFPSIWEGARALRALVAVQQDPGPYRASLRWLAGQQRGDGSWEEDVYTTALALRVFQEAARHSVPDEPIVPEEPTDGTVLGRIVSNADDAPLANARVAVAGEDEILARTGSDGRFRLELPASTEFVLEYDAEGFRSATQTAQVTAGDVLNAGDIRLPPEPDVGRVHGIVTDRETGAPVEDAIIAISGDLATETSADQDGIYTLVLPEGSYAATVSAPQFHSVNVEFSLPAGASRTFSPQLMREEDPPEQDLRLTGLVRDRDTTEPLSDASVELAEQGARVNTDSEGRFLLENLVSGEEHISVSRDGYQGRQAQLLLPSAGTVDIGTIGLAAMPDEDEPGLLRLAGQVRDAGENRDPVPRASVTVGDQAVEADRFGRFVFDGIAGDSFRVRVAAEGYVSTEQRIKTSGRDSISATFFLEPHRRGGLELSALRADRAEYDAWDEAELALDLVNRRLNPQTIRLYLAVFGPDGDLLTEEPVTPVFPEDGGADEALESARISLEPSEPVTETFSWFTEAREPGRYTLEVRAYQAFDGELLGKRSLPVQVLPTRRLELVSVRPVPMHVNQGAVEDLDFRVLFQHRSNVPVSVEAALRLLDPEDREQFSQPVTAELLPGQPTEQIHLEGPSFSADNPGEHPVDVQSSGAVPPAMTHGQSLFVAPGTRVEIEQRRTPETIAPDGDQIIDMEIRLEGREP